MLRSRRGFFDVLPEDEQQTGTAALIAARGHEAYVAELAAQGRNARPPLPPGANEIRLSSNENPLGPGHKVLDQVPPTGGVGAGRGHACSRRPCISPDSPTTAGRWGTVRGRTLSPGCAGRDESAE